MTAGRAPLYRGADAAAAEAFRPTGAVWGGNAGLWYDEFCNLWSDDFTGLGDENAKRDWVESVVRARNGAPVHTGAPALLAEHADRRRALAAAAGGTAIDLTLQARFATGIGRRHPVENGFAWHHALGVPYLAGSGVKGLVRAWATHGEAVPEDAIDRIFGPPPGKPLHVGTVILLDAMPVQPVQLVAEVMTPHTGPWALAAPEAAAATEPPADWHSPIPIPFLAVEAGAVFQFVVLPRADAGAAGRDDAEAVACWLRGALSWYGAGAKTAVGFGRFGDGPAEDPTFAFPAPPPGRSAPAGASPASRPAPSRPTRGTVDGEPVEILERSGGRAYVRFLESRDTDWVDEDEIA